MRTFEEMLKDGSLDRIIYNDSGARHYKKDDDEAKNCDYELCKKCGGMCDRQKIYADFQNDSRFCGVRDICRRVCHLSLIKRIS
jgi:hypothetical protein